MLPSQLLILTVVLIFQTFKSEGFFALYRGFVPQFLRLFPWNVIVSFNFLCLSLKCFYVLWLINLAVGIVQHSLLMYSSNVFKQELEAIHETFCTRPHFDRERNQHLYIVGNATFPNRYACHLIMGPAP